jgi:hypothetical protein
MTRLFLLLLLAIVFDGRGFATDPLEGIVKDFVYAARTTIQQVILMFCASIISQRLFKQALNQFRLPKFSPTDLSFQTDSDENDNTFRCPLCSNSQRIAFSGTWSVVLWSRSFYLTTISDVNRIIDKLEANKPIYTDQPLKDLFGEIPEIRCPRLTGNLNFKMNHIVSQILF